MRKEFAARTRAQGKAIKVSGTIITLLQQLVKNSTLKPSDNTITKIRKCYY
jgi:hypothetical protein